MSKSKLKPIRGTLAYENGDVDLIESFERKGYRTVPTIYVNGKQVRKHLARDAKPNQTLLSFLREVLHLTGSKLGCAEGGCGACTVMLSRYDKVSDKILHYSVNACLMPVLAADGCHITTVEGVGTVKHNGLHPIQDAMVEMHGSQCGFCTPGIVVALYSLFANNSSTQYIEEHLDGNLCRCTGYRPIWDAAKSLCTDKDKCTGESKGESDVTRGPCGTACRECPERDECAAECNIEDMNMAAEERKENTSESKAESKSESSSICCSSTADKIKESESSAYNNQDGIKWLNQPNDMFPEELKNPPSSSLMVVDRTFTKAGTWFKPTSLVQLLSLLKEFEGGCKIVVGNTEVGIETKFKHSVFPRLISPSHSISSLFSVSLNDTKERLVIGSCASLSLIQKMCGELVGVGGDGDGDFHRIAKPIHDMLRWFASSQIRNVASLGGNLATASPISDMNPMLACMGAELVVASYGANDSVLRRSVKVRDFFLSYRKVDLKPYEFIEAIEIPKTKSLFEYVVPFKQARRREDDISIVTSGMRIEVGPTQNNKGYIISGAHLAFGGMAPTTVMAELTEKFLVGKPFEKQTFVDARQVLQGEFDLPDDVPGGQAQYRKALASSFVFQLFFNTLQLLRTDVKKVSDSPGLFSYDGVLPAVPTIDEKEMTAADSFVDKVKPSICGTQKYPAPRVYAGCEEKSNDIPMAAKAAASKSEDKVGKSATHASGPLHCTGEALYTDDVPLPPGTLHATLVMAQTCSVEFLSIDKSTALDTPGVVAVYTHEDLLSLGGDNAMGPILHDEFVFLPLGERVHFVGQVLGVCIAEDLESSEAGARAVKVEYSKSTEKAIVSIEDAIEAGSFYEMSRHSIDRKLPVEVGSGEEVVNVTGSFRCGGQEHFYLECNSTLAVPSESATNLTVYCSTQAVTKTQVFCASATNTPQSKVVVKMKRMGGGFGGKETRSVFASCAASVAAKISDRPVRLTLDRNVDMQITGTRHAFMAKYKASAIIKPESDEVKLRSLDVQLYSNGGSAYDLSGPVLDRALFHSDNTYYWPDFHAKGIVCKTVQPPHTAYRGFGGPQGLAACEHVIDHLALACGISGDQLRKQNLYSAGERTPFGMTLGEEFAGQWNVPRMWDRLYNELNVVGRRREIAEFNKQNKWKKRGLAIVPTKFGIAFTAKFMNQGGCLVHLYTDGTVLVSHGGTEMGQGLHTKVCQIAAQAFGIPLNDVYINDTSSDKVANTIPTAASMSTDLYGMACHSACTTILKRIEPIREKLPKDASLKDIASAAFFERVDLSAHGFFAIDDARCGFEWDKEKPDGFTGPENSWKGHPFNYFTQGCVCTEVEIDILTGNHSTTRSDILVDVGRSINPSLDIGQIEGAFIQGMGWSTLEEVVYGDDDHTWIRPRGRTFTAGPGTYKIPAFNDVPEEFNVALMDDVDNPFAVHSSKAIGEPPFFLGACVFFAIKDAIMSARQESDVEGYFELRMPATSERIRMACADEIASECINTNDVKGFQPKGSL